MIVGDEEGNRIERTPEDAAATYRFIAEVNEKTATQTLTYYFERTGLTMGWDSQAEMKDLVECIVRAAVARVQTDLAMQRAQTPEGRG